MEDTLNHYENKPIKGETIFFATSLESVLDFTRGLCGLDSSFSVVTTEQFKLFYCHSQKSENKVYKVLLGVENGQKAEAFAVYDMDTSQWNLDHTLFLVLGIEPGNFPCLPFFPC
ncbi:hypothetical protein FEM48_Zijuj09G0106300 [Ziziphus jujuba var. spinosa]|uniref:BURP domain-containing protein n=1 Tax=Ziziphus jujuba var. spinosa TaxID=714518 RepID=A0A978USI4_ZIZJJ|nr:hypothetical protein FEM48_Zijuj09G0106300 [Ziziphus jujuba var. spinosa]